MQVVLVHGWLDTPHDFKRLSHALSVRGHSVHAPAFSSCWGNVSLDILTQEIVCYIQQSIPPHESYILIGFSMGGLVARSVLSVSYMRKPAGCITIATPHHGTLWAHLSPLQGLRQMASGSTFLADLERSSGGRADTATISLLNIYSLFDGLIIPAHHAYWESARNVMIPVWIHPRILRNKKVIETCLRFVDQVKISTCAY